MTTHTPDASQKTTSTTPTGDTLAGGTTHAGLQAWVDEVAALTTPDQIEWVTGSDAEWTRLTDKLVAAGTFVRLNDRAEAEQLLRRLRPDRRRPGRGPHLHLLRRGEGRRAHQQLDGPRAR